MSEGNLFEKELRLPKDPAIMSRKERRKWHRENRKRLGLPRWNELSKLKSNV